MSTQAESNIPLTAAPDAAFTILGTISGVWRRMTLALASAFACHKIVTPTGGITLDAATHPPGTLIRMNNSAAANIFVPADSSYSFPIGGIILILRANAQITVQAGSGATVRFASSRDNLNGQYALGELIKVAANEWVFTGDTSAT
jgi:hypothetical protein